MAHEESVIDKCRTGRRRGLWWLELATAVAAVAVVVAGALTTSEPPDLVALVLFTALLVWAENVAVRLPTSTRISPSFMVAMATVTAYRGHGALLGVAVTGASGGLVFDHLRRRRYRIVVFNCAQYLLAAAAAETVYNSLRSADLRGASALALLAAAGAFWTVNTGLIVPAITLDTGTPAKTVWRDLAPTIPNYFAFGLLGTLLGYLYRRMGALAVLVLASPIVVARSVFLSFLQLRQAYSRLELLYGFTGAVGPVTDHAAVIETILPELRRLLRTEVAQLHLVGADGDTTLSAAADGGNDRPALGPGTTITALVTQEVSARDRAFHVGPLAGSEGRSAEGRASGGPLDIGEALSAAGLVDTLVAPIRLDGRVAGALLVSNRGPDEPPFSDQDVQLFETVANHASVSLERGRLIDRLLHDSTHDALTGLANRALLFDALGAAVAQVDEHGGEGAVLLMDLDRFKEVNDTLGHDIGDALLRTIGRRLAELVTPPCVVARLGGDEFAVVLPEIAGEIDATRTASLLLDALRTPLPVGDINLELGASIGIARFPAHGMDAATLLRRADMAMYGAKADRLGWGLYDRSADLSSPRRLAIASDLRQAIESGELTIYYQPKADLSSGRCVGMEALVRWEHPRFGPLVPDEFIPLAEQTGLVRPLTSHVLERSLCAVAWWRRLGYDLDVAVNLSVRVLLDASFPDQVAAALAAHDVPAHRLTLEITESSVMADPTGADALQRLSDLGVTLSVDDFGTGYSSLSYLRGLPVQEVKIDRSFVANVLCDGGDAVIVRSIVDLGRHLGLRVVAEGVEDEALWDRLRLDGCDQAQGFYLAKPLPGDEVVDWLEHHEEALA